MTLVAEAPDRLRMASDIVCSYVRNNPLSPAGVSDLLHAVHNTLGNLTGNGSRQMTDQPPAVPIKKSITPDYLVCLEDGKRLKMLKRYLRSRFKLSPEQYRAKWGLPADYPMVSANYAAVRSDFAKNIGLGRRSKRAKR